MENLIVNDNFCAQELSVEEMEMIDGGGWRCYVGAGASAILGALTGASVASITLPVVGTIAGWEAGYWAGAAMGAAAFC
jgi:hypothetical protein